MGERRTVSRKKGKGRAAACVRGVSLIGVAHDVETELEGPEEGGQEKATILPLMDFVCS